MNGFQQNELQKRRRRISLKRVLICLVSLIQRISLLTSLIILYNKCYFILVLFLLLLQCIVVVGTIYNVFIRSASSRLINKVLMVLFYVPTQKDINLLQTSIAYYIKLSSHLIESIVFLALLISEDQDANQDERQIFHQVIYFTTHFLSSCLFSNFKKLNFKKKYSLYGIIYKILFDVIMRNALLGYFLLCHLSSHFKILDLVIILALISSFVFQNQCDQFVYYIQFKNDRVDYMDLIDYRNSFFAFFGFYKKFKNSLQDEKSGRDSQGRDILSFFNVCQLILLVAFDIIVNEKDKGNSYRSVLYFYIAFLLPYIIKVIKWFILYVKYGPFCRQLKINCIQVEDMAIQYIEEKYFQFNPYQKQVIVNFRGFKQVKFEEIFSYLLKTGKIINLYFQEYDDYLYLNKSNNTAILNVSDRHVTESILKCMTENIQFYYQCKIYFEEDEEEKINPIIQKILLRYLQIIPNTIINTEITRTVLIHFINEIRKIIVFNAQLKQYLHFSPFQIYYDLYDK